ncbi:MAG: hypothetical protein ABFS12_00850 [Bacteroidota bacterium]
MKKIFILSLILVEIVFAQDSTAFFTLQNGQEFQGCITEINDTYLMVNDKDAVLYKVLSSIELTNKEAIKTIQNYVPEVKILEKTESAYLLTFEHLVFDKAPKVANDTSRVPFYDHPTSISVGMFINANEGAFGFTLKAGYAKMISKGLALGGFLAYNEWSPRGTVTENAPVMSSGVSTVIELVPILYVLPSEFDYDTGLYFQVGVGPSLSSSSSFILDDAESDATSTSTSNIGGISTILGIGSFEQIKLLGWVSISLNYHLGYSQKNFTNYVSIEFGIYL